MDRNIFEILTEHGLDERFDDILLRDVQYQESQDEISEIIEKFDGLGLPQEQKIIVDRLISAHTKSGYCYGRVAYQQGIRDCATLLWEMGLLKMEPDMK